MYSAILVIFPNSCVKRNLGYVVFFMMFIDGFKLSVQSGYPCLDLMWFFGAMVDVIDYCFYSLTEFVTELLYFFYYPSFVLL